MNRSGRNGTDSPDTVWGIALTDRELKDENDLSHAHHYAAQDNRGSDEFRWCGFGANASISRGLSQIMRSSVRFDSFCMRFENYVKADEIENAIKQLNTVDESELRSNIDERAINGMKFNECVPFEMAIEMLAERLHDRVGVEHLKNASVQTIVSSGD